MVRMKIQRGSSEGKGVVTLGSVLVDSEAPQDGGTEGRTQGGQASHAPRTATWTGLRRAISLDFGNDFMLSWVQLSQQGPGCQSSKVGRPG